MKKIVIMLLFCSLTYWLPAQNLPVAFTHENEMGISLNQGNQGSCVAMAGAHAQTFYEAQEEGWNSKSSEYIISPAFIYNSLRTLETNQSGIGFESMLNFMTQAGALFLSDMPYNELDDTTQANFDLRIKALQYKIAGYRSSKNHQEAKWELVNNGPIISQIHNPTSNHALCIVGYNDTIQADSTVGAFRIMNSLGPNWGENGFGWLPYHRFKEKFYFFDNRPNVVPELIFHVISNLGFKNRWTYTEENKQSNFYFLNNGDTIKKLTLKPCLDDWLLSLDTTINFREIVVTSSYVILRDKPTQLMEMTIDSFQLYDPNQGIFIPLEIEAERIDSILDTIIYSPVHINYLLGSWYKAIIRLPEHWGIAEPENSVVFYNFPNPFSEQTSFFFSLRQPGFVDLKIYDLLGKLVANPWTAQKQPGEYQLNFSNSLPLGVYLAALTVNGQTKTIKLMVQ